MPWQRKTLWLAILCSLSITGCQHKLSEPIIGLETTNCDPTVRTDCWSVSEQFVRERFASEEMIVRTKDALKQCREK